MRTLIFAGLPVALAVVATGIAAQQASEGASRPEPAPAPRWPDGRVNFSAASPTDVGNWDGPADSSIFSNVVNGQRVTAAPNLPTNLTIDEIPFKPGVRKIYDDRRTASEDPHTRCKPSGGPRFWHTPYGIEVLDLPETQEMLFLHVGSPHSWRIAYMDGREHPKDLKPTWYGHTTAKWEGDTLVMDSVGFNDKFWLTRQGVPLTTQLHLIEKLTRVNHDLLRYEATVDDPGAYTAPWSGGWNLRWRVDSEPFDYLCQENNRDPERMIGREVE
ncbi:MAG: hypothetical protein LBE59_05805 [Nevskiaceae bacterium]|jgi:hypothetical protein|nr:hypothetical protein [Nevskiaceae bacterium]